MHRKPRKDKMGFQYIIHKIVYNLCPLMHRKPRKDKMGFRFVVAIFYKVQTYQKISYLRLETTF